MLTAEGVHANAGGPVATLRDAREGVRGRPPHLRFGAGVAPAGRIVPTQHLRSGQVCPSGGLRGPNGVGANRTLQPRRVFIG